MEKPHFGKGLTGKLEEDMTPYEHLKGDYYFNTQLILQNFPRWLERDAEFSGEEIEASNKRGGIDENERQALVAAGVPQEEVTRFMIRELEQKGELQLLEQREELRRALKPVDRFEIEKRVQAWAKEKGLLN